MVGVSDVPQFRYDPDLPVFRVEDDVIYVMSFIGGFMMGSAIFKLLTGRALFRDVLMGTVGFWLALVGVVFG